MTIDELLDREAIRDLMARYNIASDRGRREEFAAVFDEYAVLQTAFMHLETRAGIVRGLFAAPDAADPPARSPSFVRHQLASSQLCFPAPGEATGRTYFSVITDIGLDHSGVYVDRFVKRKGRWYIAARAVRIDFVHDDTLMLAAHLGVLRGARGGQGPA